MFTGAERAKTCGPLPAGAYLLGVMPPELLQLLELDLPLRRRSPHYFLPTTGDKCGSAELQQLVLPVHTLPAASLRGLCGSGCHLENPALLFTCLPCALHCQCWCSPCAVGASAVLPARATACLQVSAAGRGCRGQQAPVPALLFAGVCAEVWGECCRHRCRWCCCCSGRCRRCCCYPADYGAGMRQQRCVPTAAIPLALMLIAGGLAGQ